MPPSSDAVFVDMADTPMFRQRLAELEENCSKIRSKCNALLSQAKKYRDVLAQMSREQVSWANAIADFSSDLDLFGVSASFLQQHSAAFKKTSEHYELLSVQMEVMVCEFIQKGWIEGQLQGAKEARKHYDKKLSECDSSRMKYLALKKVTKKETLEKAQAEVAATRVFAEAARFLLAKKLSEVDSRKSFSFLEAMVSNFTAHAQFFAKGDALYETLATSVMKGSMELVDMLKSDEEERTKKLDAMIEAHKQAVAQREQLVNEAASMSSDSGTTSLGPLQMSSTNATLNSEIERLITATQQTGGTQVTVIKQGYLYKKNTTSRLAAEKRRFFVLDSQGMLYYYSHKESFLPALLGKYQKETPQNTVNLLTSTIKMDDEEGVLRHAFRVISPAGLYTLQAENELERQEWVEAIQGVINCLLNGAVGPSQMPTKPKRATHSRSNSLQDIDMSPQRASICPSTPPISSLGSPTGSLNVPAMSTVERLRVVPGNTVCADCGAPEPEWASLNLGELICIECSGCHRQLGVQVSKVRSLTLDVNAWGPTIMMIHEALGNDFANQVWEANLSKKSQRAESWVWCDDESDEEASEGSPQRREHLNQRVLVEGTNVAKPTPTSTLQEKQKFIMEKYVNRGFAENISKSVAQLLLWDGTAAGDVRSVLRALAGSADFGHMYDNAAAEKVVADVHSLSSSCPVEEQVISKKPDAESDEESSDGGDGATALHLACSRQDVLMTEFLLQNNAPFEAQDTHGRTPLHYCVLLDWQEGAKMLMKRGANPAATDSLGLTAMDLAVAKGKITDEEMFVLLTKQKK